MPLREPDPDDPMELVGVPVPSEDDALLENKAECFIEEFLRLGHPPEGLVRLFQNPFYVGAHELYRALGEGRIRELVGRASRRFGFGFEV